LSRLLNEINQSSTEQIAVTGQVTRSMDGIRKQSGQVAQAMLEQSRANRDAVAGADNVAKQVRRITAVNKENSVTGETLLKSITEIRGITEHNLKIAVDARTLSESLKGFASGMSAGDNHSPKSAAPSRRAGKGKNRKSR